MNNQRKTASPSFQSPRTDRGFTMIELLVVMFVIGMLLIIGVPAAMRFQIQAKLNACRVTVNIIDKAVDMYHKQHKSYPSMEEMTSKLIGQSFDVDENDVAVEVVDGDWHPGAGYRLEPRGTVYGPWNGVDKLARTGDYDGNPIAARKHFLDAFGRPIWYCPFERPTPTLDPKYTDSLGVFKFKTTNTETGEAITIDNYAKDASGKYYRRDYILMSQGADGKWGLIRGTDSPGGSAGDIVPTDDITNFTKD